MHCASMFGKKYNGAINVNCDHYGVEQSFLQI
jgi:hypothetical protein